ncbi:MAG: hypothetical protein AAF637_15230 [Pseudomonadota bacterium]
MRPAIVSILFATLVLVACQPERPQFQVDRTRVYQQSKQVVWDKVVAFLQANDITVRRSDFETGTIEANRDNYQDAGWAYCEPAVFINRTTNSRRPRRARIFLDRSLALRVDVGDGGAGVRVSVDARFTERQMNQHRNMPERIRCQSKGVLERSLLDSI